MILELTATSVIIYFGITLLAFTVATTLGIGGPLILIPALMVNFSSAQSVAIVVPIMFANNVLRAYLFQTDIQKTPAWKVGILAIPFAFAASFLTGTIAPKMIKLFVLLAIIYPLASQYLFKYQPKVSDKMMTFWGAIIGTISGLTGTAGPPMAIAFRGYGLILTQFVATTAILQASLQLVRFPIYYSTGLITKDLLPFSLLLAIASILSVFIGTKLLKNIKPNQFRIYLDILLVIIAIWITSSLFQ